MNVAIVTGSSGLIRGESVDLFAYKFDLVNVFWYYYQSSKQGEVYNAGGGRFFNGPMFEAMELCEKISGNKMNYSYAEPNRIGAHIWYISDVSQFKNHYPNWDYQFNLEQTLEEMFNNMVKRV